MSRIIDREKFLDNCIHTFLSVHSDIQQPYTCTIYTRVLVYRYRFEHALLLRTRAQASRCCGLHRCPSSCLSLHSSSSSGGGSTRRTRASAECGRLGNLPKPGSPLVQTGRPRSTDTCADHKCRATTFGHLYSIQVRVYTRVYCTVYSCTQVCTVVHRCLQ